MHTLLSSSRTFYCAETGGAWFLIFSPFKKKNKPEDSESCLETDDLH